MTMDSKKKKSKSKKEKKSSSKRKEFKTKIKLKVAKKDDFMELDRYVQKKGKKRKKFKPKYGIPYWQIGNSGITNWPYIFNEDTDMEEFLDYMSRNQILIAKKYEDLHEK